jgi:hypothetical protein
MRTFEGHSNDAAMRCSEPGHCAPAESVAGHFRWKDQPHRLNPAMAVWFQIESYWRRVGDPRR